MHQGFIPRGDGDCGDKTTDDEHGANDDLAHVLPLQTAQLIGLAGEIGARGEKFLADERVVAGRDEERKLTRHRGTRDLNRPHGVARLGENQTLGEEAAHVKAGGGLLPNDEPRAIGRVTELFVGDVVDEIRVVCVGATGAEIRGMDGLASGTHHQRTAGRHLDASVVFRGRLGDSSQHRDSRDRLQVIHVLNARNIKDRSAHLRCPADRFVDRGEAGDLANRDGVPASGPVDEEEYGATEEGQDEEEGKPLHIDATRDREHHAGLSRRVALCNASIRSLRHGIDHESILVRGA